MAASYKPESAFATSSANSFSTATAGPGRTFSFASGFRVLAGKQLLASHTISLNDGTVTVISPGFCDGLTTNFRSNAT